MSFSPFVNQQTEAVKSTVTSIVSMEPAYNVLVSMSLLTAGPIDPEREPWLAEAASQLTPEQRQTNLLVFAGFGAALLPEREHTDFPAYLKVLSTQPAELLRDRVLAQIETLSAEEQAANEALITEVHDHLNDLSGTQRLIIEHLQTLWQTQFAGQWARMKTPMNTQTITLNSRTWPTESASAVVRAFMRRSIPDEINVQLAGVRHLIFVPSPYVQLYSTQFNNPNTLWIFMYADFWIWPMRTEPTKRSEIRGPAAALADDTRLQILEMLAAYKEMRSQEIIAQLDVSQPTVSRHLKQLRNAQFITEQRTEDANKRYRLNHQRLGQFAFMLRELLTVENARMVLSDVRLEQPEELRSFMNRDGLITQWPARNKNKSRQAILDYLIAKFEQGTEYTEPQVNELLDQWHTYRDPVYLRRSLIDAGMLKRTPDSSRYWLPEE